MARRGGKQPNLGFQTNVSVIVVVAISLDPAGDRAEGGAR